MYGVEFLSRARKDLKRIDNFWRKKILIEIEKLAQNPFAKSDVKKLTNSPYFRLRVGDYRIVYDLIKDKLVILVINIKKREDIYRRL
jgi:mRNA interferase RelE/StbE